MFAKRVVPSLPVKPENDWRLDPSELPVIWILTPGRGLSWWVTITLKFRRISSPLSTHPASEQPTVEAGIVRSASIETDASRAFKSNTSVMLRKAYSEHFQYSHMT